MMTDRPHPLAAAWLDRVDRLAAGLPAPARAELLADLRDHLDAALPADPDDVQVAAVLERLGDPAEVVGAAAVDAGGAGAAPPPPPPARATGEEVAVVVALLASGVLLVVWPLAIVAWFLGLWLLLARSRWRGLEVLVALLLPLVGALPLAALVLPAIMMFPGSFEGSGGTDLDVVVLGVAVVVGMVLAVVLLVRWLLRRVRGRPLAA